jgi:hypothetical protein
VDLHKSLYENLKCIYWYLFIWKMHLCFWKEFSTISIYSKFLESLWDYENHNGRGHTFFNFNNQHNAEAFLEHTSIKVVLCLLAASYFLFCSLKSSGNMKLLAYLLQEKEAHHFILTSLPPEIRDHLASLYIYT